MRHVAIVHMRQSLLGRAWEQAKGKILLDSQLCVGFPFDHKMCENRADVPGVLIKMHEMHNAIFFQHK